MTNLTDLVNGSATASTRSNLDLPEFLARKSVIPSEITELRKSTTLLIPTNEVNHRPFIR